MKNTGVYTEKITTGALLAALFAVTALLFKGFVIVPMITELRVVNAYPVVFGLLFGNVGAWACALGNLLGDIAGSTFSFASLGGFIANYAMTYVPYKVWAVLWRKEDEPRFVLRGISSYGKFLFLCFLSSIVPAIIIPVFTDILGIVSFNILFVIIFFNDFIASSLLGTFIYYMISKLKTGSFLALQAKIMDIERSTRQKNNGNIAGCGCRTCLFACGGVYFHIFKRIWPSTDIDANGYSFVNDGDFDEALKCFRKVCRKKTG